MFKPEVGAKCSFYHSGGHGERRWVIGWRFGIVRAVPIKGQHKSEVQIEIPVRRWTQDPVTRKLSPRPNDRVWVSIEDVNAPGDFLYHGRKAEEVYQERQERKAKEQAKTDRKARRK